MILKHLYKILSILLRIVRVPVITIVGTRLAAGIKDVAEVVKVALFTLRLSIRRRRHVLLQCRQRQPPLLESGSRARPEYRAVYRNFIGGPAGLLPRSDQGNPLLLGPPQRISAIS